MSEKTLPINKLVLGHAIDVLKTFPDDSVDCFVTSPPYWNLRAYQTDPIVWADNKNCEHVWGAKIITGQQTPQTKWKSAKDAFSPNESSFCTKCGAWRGELGAEPTPDLFINHLCDVFDQVKRVLKPTGTAWINIADSYGGSGGAGGDYNEGGLREGQPKFKGNNYQPKSLVGIPERMVLEMQARGWIRRNTIIWHKPNCLSGGTKLYAKTQKGTAYHTLKDLARLAPETVQLWDGEKWNKVVKWTKNDDPKNIKKIELINGSVINCTGDHLFMVNGIQVAAEKLKIGDILDSCVLPDNKHTAELIPDEIGWLIGLYIAEGSRGDHGNCLQFSSHMDEKERYLRLKHIAERYDESCNEYITSENGKTINIYSKVLASIIDTYVSGKNCYNKHLSSKAWRRNNKFLGSVLLGYLDGDGHYDKKNNRWRIGFTRKNSYLADDLRTICARLGYDCRIKRLESAYLGNIRFKRSTHFNYINPYQIVSIRKGKKSGNYWDITLEDSPHLFSTHDGILVHNCMPSSAEDRFTSDFEHLYFFTKSTKYYFEKQLEPYDGPINRWGGVEVDGTGESLWDEGTGQTTYTRERNLRPNPEGRNKRTVWSINTEGYKGAHFAVFPRKLVETPIKAGCPEGGVVLDCFAGSGTTCRVAYDLKRKYVGIELNPEFMALAEKRLAQQNLFDFM
jgi:DNA modification methylase